MKMRFYLKRFHSGRRLRLMMVLLCLLNATGSMAGDYGFYQDTKRGWFWYESPPLEQEYKENKENKPQSVTKDRKVPSLDNYSVDELWNMHPDNFQSLLNDVQKNAVRTPTESNIMEYLTMQDIARRKALAYTNATMYVTQKYGDLFNVNQIYPAAAPGVSARVAMQQQEIEETITRAGDSHALLFFVDPGCGFCEKQSQILGYFKDKYSWQFKAVDITRNSNAPSRCNITTTPTHTLPQQPLQL